MYPHLENGGYTDWSLWSKCNVPSCGNNGTQYKYRCCTYFTQYGQPCDKREVVELRECHVPCPSESIVMFVYFVPKSRHTGSFKMVPRSEGRSS